MSISRQLTGKRAEDLCAERVRARGWAILARNWRIRAGELDLVARDGRTLVFVEVKATHTGIHHGPALPVLAVGPLKQQRLRRLAAAWLAGPGQRLPVRDVRFDVVGVSLDRGGRLAAYDHIENAF